MKVTRQLFSDTWDEAGVFPLLDIYIHDVQLTWRLMFPTVKMKSRLVISK